MDTTTILQRMADTAWGRTHCLEHNGRTVTRLLSDLDLKAPRFSAEHLGNTSGVSSAPAGCGYAIDGIITHVFPYTPRLVDSCTLELSSECGNGFVIFLRYSFATIHDVFRMHEFLDSDSEQRSTIRRLFNADGVSYEEHRSIDPDKMSYSYPAGFMYVTTIANGFWIEVWFRGMGKTAAHVARIHDGRFDIGQRRCLVWDHTVQLLPCYGKGEA